MDITKKATRYPLLASYSIPDRLPLPTGSFQIGPTQGLKDMLLLSRWRIDDQAAARTLVRDDLYLIE
jgi:hypothetical protein